MTIPEGLTPDEKIVHIEQQMRLVEMGAISEIGCPYCGVFNVRGEPLCCNLFAAVAMAICDARDLDEHKELAERIAEKIT